jgi:hypothetical protein
MSEDLQEPYFYVRARPGARWHICGNPPPPGRQREWHWALCGEWGRLIDGHPPTPARVCQRCRRVYERRTQG